MNDYKTRMSKNELLSRSTLGKTGKSFDVSYITLFKTIPYNLRVRPRMEFANNCVKHWLFRNPIYKTLEFCEVNFRDKG